MYCTDDLLCQCVTPHKKLCKKVTTAMGQEGQAIGAAAVLVNINILVRYTTRKQIDFYLLIWSRIMHF